MGREVKRVPLTYSFPIGESAADAICEARVAIDKAHTATCPLSEHDYCVYPTLHVDEDAVPPKGDGWQLWQTVSDGPISPVFATPEELIDFMCQPDTTGRVARGFGAWDHGYDRATAERFVRGEMHAPSFFIGPDGIVDGATFVTRQEPKP